MASRAAFGFARLRVRLQRCAWAAWVLAITSLLLLALLCNHDAVRLTLRLRAAPRRLSYSYAYASGAVPFPMLALGRRRDPACPGGPDSPPYITVESGGRLGNLAMEYASVWALATAHHLPAFVPDILLRRLKAVFEEPSLPAASDVRSSDPACPAADPPNEWEPWESLTRVDLAQVPLASAVQAAWDTRSFIVLDMYSNLPEAVVPMAKELCDELRFKPLLRRAADTTLRNLRLKLLPGVQEVLFVGVHARRTDYAAHLKLLYNLSHKADEGYFVRAASWLRKRVDEDAGPRKPPGLLLVISSDDQSWAKNTLLPALEKAGSAPRRHQGEGEKSAGVDWVAAWAGSGDEVRPDGDLALLSACNHSIFAYGTFGLTAALLSGGRAVVFRLAEQENDPSLLTPAEQYARHMPGWAALR